jgi:lysozyme
MDVYEQIQRDEGGYRLKPYFDCCGRFWSECECPVKGKLSIGVGRNLDDRGITATEGHLLFTHDVAAAKADVNTRLPWAASALDDARYGVLVNMCFNIGIGPLMRFQRMLAAMRGQDWQKAADELMDSEYAQQVGDRARRLSEQMRSGRWH